MTGIEVRYKLKESGISFANISLQLGISQQGLQNRLRAKDVKLDFLQSLAKAINKNIYYFIGPEKQNVNLNVNPIVNLNDKKDHLTEADTLTESQNTSYRKRGILLVPVKTRAGYLSDYGDPEYIEKLEYYTVPGCINGNYRIFEVEGHSMHPALKDGDYVVGQRVTDCCNIKNGSIYIIVSRSEGIVIKRVLNDPKTPGKLVLYSENYDQRTYPPIIAMGSSILECWELYKIITSLPDGEDPVVSRLNILEGEIEKIKRSFKRK